jgi:hypothetical protein
VADLLAALQEAAISQHSHAARYNPVSMDWQNITDEEQEGTISGW